MHLKRPSRTAPLFFLFLYYVVQQRTVNIPTQIVPTMVKIKVMRLYIIFFVPLAPLLAPSQGSEGRGGGGCGSDVDSFATRACSEEAAVMREYKLTFPGTRSLRYCPAAAPFRDTLRSASSPLDRAFLTICHVPPAVAPSHGEYMSVSVARYWGRHRGRVGEGANGRQIGMKVFTLMSGRDLFWSGWRRRAE
jgi:hypothetical protein